MAKFERTLDRVLRGTADANIGFFDLCTLLRHLGFDERVRGSHHIFTRNDVSEILNLQPRGGQAKPYQVKQVRNMLVSYRLTGEGPETTSETAVEGEPNEGNTNDRSAGNDSI